MTQPEANTHAGCVWLQGFLLLGVLGVLCGSDSTNESQSHRLLKDLDIFQVRISIPLLRQAEFETKTAAGWTNNGSLVFFGAPWCRHSRLFNATYQSLARKSFAGMLEASPLFWYYEVKEPKQDVLHRHFRVKGFPTVVYVSKGRYWSFDGERNLQDIENWLGDIWGGRWREGEPYPQNEPTWADDVGSIVRDIRFFLAFHVRHHPIELAVGTLCVAGSFIAVLGILGMIAYDAVFIGWNNDMEDKKNPIEELDEDEEGKLIKQNIPKEALKKLVKHKGKQVVEEEMKIKNPRKYQEMQEMKHISEVAGVSDSSDDEVEASLQAVKRVNKDLEASEVQDGHSAIRDRGKQT